VIMDLIEVVVAGMVGGLLVVSTIGYCLYIGWKWVWKDVMKDLTTAYDVYLKRSYETFKENK
jgi:hypothetical protein